MDVEQMVEQYLRENGYDGLYSRGECACLVEDLAPCGQIQGDCEAGFKVTCNNPDCEWCTQPGGWHVQKEKEAK